MAYPAGGQGNIFQTNHTFEETIQYVGNTGVDFLSTKGEQIVATAAIAEDDVSTVIVFKGENYRHGNVCEKCWGYRKDCNGSYIGQCVEALDSIV